MLTTAYYEDEKRLDITVINQLDLSISRQVFEICEVIDGNLATCVIDCSTVEMVQDAGKALLHTLLNELRLHGVRTIVIGDSELLGCETRSAMNLQLVS